MKRLLLLIPLSILLILASSFNSVTSNGVVIAIKKGKISVNGKTIVPGWSISSAKAALGEPDRERIGYNKTHTYDKLSIVLFETSKDKVPTGILSEMQVHYRVASANEVTPSGDGFTGKLTVDKLTVTSSLTPDVMKKKLKGWKVTDSYLEHSYRMSSHGIYIYFQFNDSETELLKVSFGPDKNA